MPVAILFATAVIVVAGWRFLLEGDPFRAAIARFHIKRIESTAPHPGGRIMAMIGGSHIKFALQTEDEGFAAAVAAAGLPEVQVVRITGPSGMEPLSQSFVDAMVRLKPDVLLVQDHALFYNQPETTFAEFARYCREKLKAFSRGRSLTNREMRKVERWDDVHDIPPVTITDADIAKARLQRSKCFVGEMRRDVAGLIRACHAAGIRVVVVSVPVHRRWQGVLVHAEEEAAGVDRLAAAGLCRPLRCPLEFAVEDYRDLRHMQSGARARYTRWLLGELAPELRR